MSDIARAAMPVVSFGDDIPAGTFHGDDIPAGTFH